MNKKVYVAPMAELMVFVPTDDIAASWSWRWDLNIPQTVSVTGNIQIPDAADWDYTDADKPY